MNHWKTTKDLISGWTGIIVNVAKSVYVRLLVAMLIFLLVLFIFVIFNNGMEKYISDLLGSTDKSDTLKFLGIGIGGILLILQAVASYKRAEAMEDTAKEQAKAVLNTEQGQRQERLKNAIEHLGHLSDSVRLGGAYELFHLAKDTEELGQTVLDILCAHVRRTTGEDGYRKAHKSKPSEEVQSLLALLFVQDHTIFKDLHVNLQGSWLNGANLARARLQEADLFGAQLQVASLHETLLQEANLSGAQLQKALLENAQLQEANLSGAQLQSALLENAQLQGANLFKARLQGASLNGTQLQGASLDNAQLQGANLPGAQLQGASLVNARLQGASLHGAQLQGANLHGAQLQGVESVSSPSAMNFENHISSLVGEPSDFSDVMFAGGLKLSDVELCIQSLSHENVENVRAELQSSVDEQASYELPEGCNAVSGTYTKEDTEQWIDEYDQAMSEVPGASCS